MDTIKVIKQLTTPALSLGFLGKVGDLQTKVGIDFRESEGVASNNFMKSPKIHRIFAYVAFALIGVSPGVVHAQADNTIYACVNNSSGQVIIVTENTVCSNNATLKSWNIVGPAGSTGPAGPAGVSGYEVVQSEFVSIHSGAYVLCPAGKVVVGGGFNNSAATELHASYPVGVDGRLGWYVQAGQSGDNESIPHGSLYAICVNASP